MSVNSQARAALRVAVLMALVGFVGGGATAQSASSLTSDAAFEPLAMPSHEPDTQSDTHSAIQLAALAPAETIPPPAPTAPDRGPFGMIAAHDGAMAAKWRGLQSALQIESRILDLCRADGSICPPAAARFLAIVDTARARDGRARIGAINRAINLAIRPVSDMARFHIPDVWTTPLSTFAAEAGDCEDYAIAKYVALREAGVAPHDLRIVIVHNTANNEDHAVTAARVDGAWLILDNRHMMLLTDSDVGNMTPLVTLDHEDGRRTVTVASAS
ncbi:MAG TPA: transglutaminase-like cysteine peptidase [Rhizomicrobium sp.]